MRDQASILTNASRIAMVSWETGQSKESPISFHTLRDDLLGPPNTFCTLP